MRHIGRRDFLKAAPAMTGAMALAARVEGAAAPRIQEAASVAVADYPIHPTPYFDVAVTDRFWKRKIDTNATVTIPFEVQKLMETERRLSGNVLEAAILSLRTYPNPKLQVVVDEPSHGPFRARGLEVPLIVAHPPIDVSPLVGHQTPEVDGSTHGCSFCRPRAQHARSHGPGARRRSRRRMARG